MKWIVLVFLFFIILSVIALRYRRQINFLILLWKQFQTLRSPKTTVNREIADNRRDSDTMLARCARCGNWVTQTEILKLGGATFCSTACLEKNVQNR